MKRTELITAITEGMACMRRSAMSQPAASAGDKNCPTRAQVGVLFMLAHDGPQTTKDLAARLAMTSSAVTQLVDGLVRDKSIARKEDKDDRRRIQLSLTDNGKKRLAEAKKQHVTVFTRLFNGLSDEELVQLHKIQQKIIANLS
jgi:DNA-binding MarR family transcriptional regulator